MPKLTFYGNYAIINGTDLYVYAGNHASCMTSFFKNKTLGGIQYHEN